ncbi:MAG: adenosylcobinamide-GDP ribazoletransferase [Chitinivibrionales bacterium]|nr:adenosylcobinamide-GDP ribazoletransferase [Chitinivibrionales bacterium]
MIRAFGTALRTLTVLRFPGKDTRHFAASLVFFAPVGALIAACTAGALYAITRGAPSLGVLGALAAVTVELLLTGGLHLDGLADVADGFGGARERERILAIMKDPRCGSFGVAAIALDLIARVNLYVLLAAAGELWEIFWVLTFARALQPLFLAVFPSARPDSSVAKPFAPGAGGRVAVAMAAVATLGVAGWVHGTSVMVTVMLPMAAVAGLWGLYCRERIGGITGDCIGAANEIATVAGLTAASIYR